MREGLAGKGFQKEPKRHHGRSGSTAHRGSYCTRAGQDSHTLWCDRDEVGAGPGVLGAVPREQEIL